jgi:hypothetical protein
MSTKPTDSLLRAARRAAEQPFFLASVLQAYQAANSFDDAALADLLGCTPNDLPRLGLCRRPAADQSTFAADIAHLAKRFQLNGDQLVAVIRQVDALQALRQHLGTTESASRLLRAARDRDEPADTSQENPDD